MRYLVCISMGLVSGCASVLSSGSESVTVSTNAANADVTYRGSTCSAPCSLQVPRGTRNEVLVTATGYLPSSHQLDRHANPMVFANILLGPLVWVGLLVDASSGKFWTTSDDNLYLDLEKSRGGIAAKSVSQPSIEAFEKSIPVKPEMADPTANLEDFPMGWPNKWFYESEQYKYWTIVGDKRSNPTLAMHDSLKKANITIGLEFPKDRFKKAVPFETTHVEVKRNTEYYRGWRIIRVRHTDINRLKK